MSKSLFVFFSGTAGAGKNTVIDELIKRNNDFVFLNSHTSRPRRSDDPKSGRYYYVSKEEFERLIDENKILEYDKFNDNYYGISKDEINNLSKTDKVILKDLSVKGVLNCKDIFKDTLKIKSIFLTNTKKVLKQRLIERNYSSQQIKSRLKLYKSEQSKIKFYDYVIFNNDLNLTIEQCEAVINLAKSNNNLGLAASTQTINSNKIEKLSSRLNKGRKISEITACPYENKLYILNGANEYLASLKANSCQVINLVAPPKDFAPNINTQTEWQKLIKSYS